MHNKYADHFNEWFCKCDSRNISEFEWERHISRGNINFTRCTAIGITGIAHFHLFFTLAITWISPFSITWISPFSMNYFTHSLLLFIVGAFVRSNCGGLVSRFLWYQLFVNPSFIQAGSCCCSQWVIRVVSFESCEITQISDSFGEDMNANRRICKPGISLCILQWS